MAGMVALGPDGVGRWLLSRLAAFELCTAHAGPDRGAEAPSCPTGVHYRLRHWRSVRRIDKPRCPALRYPFCSCDHQRAQGK